MILKHPFSLLILLLILSLELAAGPHKENELQIQWLGASSILIQFGGIRIVTDPALGIGENAFSMADPNDNFDISSGPNIRTFRRLHPLPAIEPEQWDIALISHTHEDHFDQAARANLPKDIQIVAPKEDLTLLKELGFKNRILLDSGQKWRYRRGGYEVNIIALPAYHTLNKELETILGHGNGYYLEFTFKRWSKSIYWSGDSFITQDIVRAVRKLGDVDIFIPNLGRVGTSGALGQISMGAQEVVEAIKQLNPARTLPIHHSTYPLYLEPISKLMDYSNKEALSVDVVSPGAWLVYK